jgi:hypothetical protein
MSENKITRNIFRSQGDEVYWWKLNNDELQNLCSSYNIVIVIKSKGMGQAGHA